MNGFNKWIIALSVVILPAAVSAQITERQRPAEWDNLIPGARFVDRFLPMPDGTLSSGVWGAANVVPRFVDNGIESPDISFWGGNILQDEKGTYHLFVCGWPENSPKGHMTWPQSTVYHAEGTKLHGPYHITDSIGPGHNPEAYRLDDGRVVVYVIDAYYIADGFDGPWEKRHFDFDTRDRRIIEGLSNITFARRQDGSRLAVCRGGGVWISRDGVAPYRQITERRIYPPVEGEFEDPVVWRDSLQYHLIVNDWLGRIAFYQRSLDGVHWVTEPGEAYVPGVSRHEDGSVERWFKYERAKVFHDRQGRPVQMNFAVIDTIKWEDLPNDNHSSKNICIPLRRDLLLDVLNRKPITSSTEKIELRIKGEDDFKPASRLDIGSLRFGSYNEVNYGRGARPVVWRSEGDDLIVTFDGNGSGIDADEFAPKLIGKSMDGEPVIGYARLPYVNYSPAILSPRKPVYDPERNQWLVDVENFGLSTSAETEIRIISGNSLSGTSIVSPIKPYDTVTLSIPSDCMPTEGDILEVRLSANGKEIGFTRFD